MFDILTLVSMIRWNLVDQDMLERLQTGKISRDKYDHYLAQRELIHDIMNHGDSHISDAKLEEVLATYREIMKH